MRFSVGGVFTVWKGTPGNMDLCGSFHNHVTDAGLNALATTALKDVFTTCHVGSGNTAPSDSDTALVTPVATTTTTTLSAAVTSGGSGYFGWRRKFRFSAGSAEGTLAEMGLSAGGALFNRQLFLDHTGSPTTITVAADEILDVLCEIRMYTPAAVTTKVDLGTVTINGQVFDQMLAFQSDAYNSAYASFLDHSMNTVLDNTHTFAAHTTNNFEDGNSGLVYDFGNKKPNLVSASAYVPGSFEQEYTLEWYAGNLNGQIDLLIFTSQSNSARRILEVGISPGYNEASETEWAPSTAYTTGQQFISALGDEFIYEVISGGTSHTSAPTWPTTVGGTVTDGAGVEYECVAPLLRVGSTEALSLTVKLSWARE